MSAEGTEGAQPTEQPEVGPQPQPKEMSQDPTEEPKKETPPEPEEDGAEPDLSKLEVPVTTGWYVKPEDRRKEYQMWVALGKVKDEAKVLQFKRDNLYKCGAKYVPLEKIPTWAQTLPTLPPETFKPSEAKPQESKPRGMGGMGGFWGMGGGGGMGMWGAPKPPPSVTAKDMEPKFPANPALHQKISVWQGDITTLEVDAVVNAANSSLQGGGGVDGAMHSAAGPMLAEEGSRVAPCPTGESRLIHGWRLPAKHVLQTVGPMGSGDAELFSSYTTCLELTAEHKLKSVAFCCVSTGIFGFPLVRATHIALQTCRKWLDDPNNANGIDRLIFCVFKDEELEVYQKLIPAYFPAGPAGAAAPAQ
eukprot:TRINITY_DN104595_c0_g1_i1.p1 TRINITY_DN104595_c0_g1~~TRINITY_DN104595_c0_g1_i1.p1  ORF type:complete len:379 (+),score=62.86 TRINITY_DN104595_c0_g1_i1:52-1137(+)